MIDFKYFYNNLEEFSKEIETEVEESSKEIDINSSKSSLLAQGLISNNIMASVAQILSPTIGILSVFSNSVKVEEFSKEVANYATSDEVISSLSEQISTPRKNETEQEFVERASNVLREILKKKFKV